MKSSMKRWMSLMLAALMCLSLLPVGALAAEEASAEPEEIIEEMTEEPTETAEETEEPVESEEPAEEEIPAETEEPTVVEEVAELEEVSAEAMGAYASSWINWSQGGSSYSAMKSGGCRLVAQSKLLAEAGVVSASSFTPDDYLKWVAANGYVNSTSAVGETKSTGTGMIAYAKSKGVTITRVATISLDTSNPSNAKSTIQSYLKQGYYIILDAPATTKYSAHQTYIAREKSISKGTPWVSNSSSNSEKYSSVSESNGIYAYTGIDGGASGWDRAFTTAYIYAVSSSSIVVEPTQYTIKFDANGGTGGPSTVTSTEGTKLTLSSTEPTKTGYTFLGWSNSSTATTATYKAGGSYTVTGAAILYAVWRANTFTVKYNANGGTGTMADTTATYGTTTTLRTNTFTKKGYTFSGWYAKRASDGKYLYTSADGSSKGWYTRGSQPSGWTFFVYKSGVTTATAVDKDTVTMFAAWTANTFTVKYNANGGSGTMADTTVTYGTTTKLRTNTFTRTGYTFAGWYAYRASDGLYRYESADGSTTNWYKEGSQPSGWTYFLYEDGAGVLTTSTVDKDTVTMYAAWEPITLTIKYDANGGGNPPASQQKLYSEALTLSTTTPTRTGYTFLGWSTSKTATKATYLPGKTYTSISSTTLYAVWSADAKTPQLVVSSAKAPVGRDVSVAVSLKDNPGINTFTMRVDYDSTKLTLKDVTPATALGGTFLYTESTHSVTWQAGSDTTYSGVAFTLHFTVLDSIQSGDAAVSVSYTKGNICNYDEEDVDFSVVAGAVSVGSYLPGDINGDGSVNNKDLNRLMKYLADNSAEVVQAALDVNGDSSVNNKDLNRLMKYLADRTVEIH